MPNKFRNYSGGIPIHIPLLLFIYTLIFFVSVEFIFLFWQQTSLNEAARQIAMKAATNSSFPANDAANRCREAASQVPVSSPGYPETVRQDFINAMQVKAISGIQNDEGANAQGAQIGDLRNLLATRGAPRPTRFWGGSGNNMQNGGCFAVQNPRTRQVTYYVIIHNGNCWPALLKGFFGSSGLGWLEGRGSYQASASLTQGEANLNRSLLSSGVRPFLVCKDDNCNFELGQSQKQLVDYENNGVCQIFNNGWPAQDHPTRPKPSTVNVGYDRKGYAIDQWPNNRGRLCPNCGLPNPSQKPEYRRGITMPNDYYKGSSVNPPGLGQIINCGDIDPLILVGLRYACKGTLYPDGRDVPAEVLARCDHYFKIIPCGFQGPNPQKGLELDKVVGDITNLDGQGRPIIVRREGQTCNNTTVECRTDSNPVKPWIGPYGFNFNLSPLSFLQANAFHQFIKAQYEAADKDRNHPLANPLDQLIPYHQFCDICPAGGPMCGFFGTCKDEETPWLEARVNLRGQWWTNTSYYELNPMYFQLECKYRRDCQSRHCCKSLWNTPQGKPILQGYCAQRQINALAIKAVAPTAIITPAPTGSGIQVTLSCGSNLGSNTWIYYGIPNADPDMLPRHDNLPHEGNFPMCSTKALLKYGAQAGDCCAATVRPLSPVSINCPQILPPFPPNLEILLPAQPCLGPNCANMNSPTCTIRHHKPRPPLPPLKPACLPLPPNAPKGLCIPNIIHNPLCKKFGNCHKPTTSSSSSSSSGNASSSGNVTSSSGNASSSGNVTSSSGNASSSGNVTSSSGITSSGGLTYIEINYRQIIQLLQIFQSSGGGSNIISSGGNNININNTVNNFPFIVNGGPLVSIPVQVFISSGGSTTTTTTSSGSSSSSSSSGSSSSSSSGGCKEKCDYYFSPIVISLKGQPLQASSNIVNFKVNPNDKAQTYKWPKFSKEQGLLAIDFNKNGKIDDGSELLGNFTNHKLYKNGYIALSQIADKNRDKLISGEELKNLLFWSDANEDGISQADELFKLDDLDIIELDIGKYLSYKKIYIGEGIYAIPYSEKGVRSVSDGKEIIGKSWDIWLKQIPKSQKPKLTSNFWIELGKFIQGVV